MPPLQSCLVGQTKPFGEKNQQDQAVRNPKPLRGVVKNGYFAARGEGSVPQALIVSKCENFDPLKMA